MTSTVRPSGSAYSVTAARTSRAVPNDSKYSIGSSNGPPPADAPKVTELMFTGPKAYLAGSANRALRQFPLAAAVEKGAMRLLSEPTRMVIVGESFFLTNGEIDSIGNRDFAGYAVNWLLDRPELLVGIGEQPVAEYKLIMTSAQLQATEWLLLAGMPGCVLLLGALVWWRRRR